MMEKERLEKIKSEWNGDDILCVDDINWLIEQAEKTSIYEQMSEEYMLEIMRLSEHQDDTFKRLKVAKDTNKHLLEAFDTKTRVHESLLKDYAALKERVQEIEQKLKYAETDLALAERLLKNEKRHKLTYRKVAQRYQDEKNRYREALEEILDSSTNDIAEFLARKALEGSK